jgi:hypothetical protein
VAAHAPARSRSRCSRSFASSTQPSAATGPAQQPRQLDRGERHFRIAAVDALGRGLQTRERLIDPTLVAEEPRQPHQIALRGPAPHLADAVAAFKVRQDSPERHDILGVVPGHDSDRPNGTAAQEGVVDGGDLRRRNVRGAMAAQEMPLHGLQARVRQAVSKQPPHEQQEVQVAAGRGRSVAVHSKARLEQRPVEASTVVGHEPGIPGGFGCQGVEQRALLRMVRQRQL